jgi:hypothetical protein
MGNKKKIINLRRTSSMDDSSDNIFLNGPINYFKLSNGSNTLHIFMDYHSSINYQTKCDEYESKDIDKYLKKILLNSFDNSQNSSMNPLDFFLEIRPTTIKNIPSYYVNDNYIWSFISMFTKIYNDKYKDSTDINSHKVRLHYIDIRDYASFIELRKSADEIFNNLINHKLTYLEGVIVQVNYIQKILNFINNMVKHIINKKEYPN